MSFGSTDPIAAINYLGNFYFKGNLPKNQAQIIEKLNHTFSRKERLQLFNKLEEEFMKTGNIASLGDIKTSFLLPTKYRVEKNLLMGGEITFKAIYEKR